MNAAPPKTAPTQSSRSYHAKAKSLVSPDCTDLVINGECPVDYSTSSLPVGQARRAVCALVGTGDSSDSVNKELHDIDFYHDLIEELPNCPVVHSILHTHRCVLEDAETPDEALEQLHKLVSSWKKERAEAMNLENENKNQGDALNHLSERLEAEKKEEERNAAIRQLEYKITELEMQVKANVDNLALTNKDIAEGALKAAEEAEKQANEVNKSGKNSETTEHQALHTDTLLPIPFIVTRGSPFMKEWIELQDRIQQRDRELREDCERIDQRAKQTKEIEVKFELAANEAKIGINEQLLRGLLYSEEEKYRVQIRREAGVSKERIQHQEDAISYIVKVVFDGQRDKFAKIRNQFYEGFSIGERNSSWSDREI